MLVPECAASMMGVPVPSIRICERGATEDGVGEDDFGTWARIPAWEVDPTRTAAVKARARHREDGACFPFSPLRPDAALARD